MTEQPFRAFDPARDMRAIERIWVEIGWLDPDKCAPEATAWLFEAGHAEVATIDGRAECLVHWTPGSLRYLDRALDLGVVTAVTTGHAGRKRGFAQALTARALAGQAEAGMAVSALGMFDQGFYDKAGFGVGCYVNEVSFDPATLTVERAPRPPRRLGAEDYAQVHQAMAKRKLLHGSVVLHAPELTKLDMLFTEKPFGLGYYDGAGGALSHFIWGEMKGEHGPYRVTMRAYQTTEQLMELLALIKSLGDQVSSFILNEFGEFQFQDLLRTPARNARLSRGGRHAQRLEASAIWQSRILDLGACMAAARASEALSFNLTLADPVAALLDEYGRGASAWRGVGGEWTAHLDADGGVVAAGHKRGLPRLVASVGAFSRMWLGARPASHLAITDALSAEADLLARLDAAFRLPLPDFGWDF